MRAELSPGHPSVKKRAHGGRAHGWRAGDPRDGLTREQIDALCQTYQASNMTVRQVAEHAKIAQDRMMQIIRLEGCPQRGRGYALKRSRPKGGIGYVFCGMAPLRLPRPDNDALEKAKTILRKQGRVVFNATIDGSGGKGMVKCDGRLFTAAEIIQRAAL